MVKKSAATVTDVLREAIEHSDHSVRELARRADLQPSQVTRFLKGERGLSGDAVNKLCAVLGLKLTGD